MSDVPLPGGGTMVRVAEGATPLVLAMPHTGTHVPEDVWADLNAVGRALSDTDWRIEALYDGLADGASTVRMCVHRYAIDCNRPPDGASLYPGQATTDLVPLTDFDGRAIWSREPDAAEVGRRREAFHAPYHAALTGVLDRTVRRHGHAVLWDGHSIRSVVPRLFDGTLPALNLGTDGGRTCDPALQALVADALAAAPFAHVVNGRFRGGWTTRHHGDRPDVHALQMEVAQSAYLSAEAPPWALDAAKAERLRATLRPVLAALADWRPS